LQYVKNRVISAVCYNDGAKNRTFADMNSDSFYILLLCFVSGFTQCMLMGCGINMLRHHREYQFQRVFALVVILHSIGFFNNFVVLACRNLPFSEFLNSLLLLFDYVIVGGYMMFGVSLVFPDRFTKWQLLLIEVPFVAAMLLFGITQNPMIIMVVQVFTVIASLVLMIYLEYSIKRHTKMLLENLGNIEYFDLRWGAILIALYFGVALVWAFESVSQRDWFTAPVVGINLLFDTIYCLIIVAVVLFAVRKMVRQKVFVVTEDENETEKGNALESNTIQQSKPPIYSDLDKTMLEKRYYQDNTLTLQKLAQHLGTNRQYLSNYINQEKHETFYDYINDFRLTEAKAMLDGKGTDNQHSLEDISVMSGFNSYATFLRSFKKKYGQTPSQYLTEKKP
jgi:AraC-like DNA-binding protein